VFLIITTAYITTLFDAAGGEAGRVITGKNNKLLTEKHHSGMGSPSIMTGTRDTPVLQKDRLQTELDCEEVSCTHSTVLASIALLCCHVSASAL
jgi:hypothetical protein